MVKEEKSRYNTASSLPYFTQSMLLLIVWLILPTTGTRQTSEEPTVQAILFYSPSCPHCHQALKEIMVPLKEQYGHQLQIVGIDTTQPNGEAFYLEVTKWFEIPENRQVVPTLIVGETVLVSRSEIADQFPSLIEEGLASGGIGWPDIPEMKYVFGPVPSRRLGQSLGIDTIPLKTCNWNCVYCQLGRTVPLTNDRQAYYPSKAILAEVAETLAWHRPGEIDFVTFVGSGEPTLHSDIGLLILEVKSLTDLPLALITNGSLLYLPDVRHELARADVVMPSLDAGTADLYRQINRPHAQVTFERLVEGLVAFRQEYDGKLWVEVMLVQGLNDTVSALQAIAAVLRRIQPDEVHINLPTRPPAETWVQAPEEEGLMRARAILGDIATVVHPVEGSFDLSGYDTAVEAIIGIITRHPMCQEELERTLARWTPDRVGEALADLEESGLAQIVERYGVRFWSAAPSRYPDEVHSAATAPGQRDHR